MRARKFLERRVNRRGLLAAGSATLVGMSPGSAGIARSTHMSATRLPIIHETEAYRFSLVLETERKAKCGALARGAREAAEELGIVLEVQAPQLLDPRTQADLVYALVPLVPDAILFASTDPVAMLQPIQSAIDAGILLVTVDAQLEADVGIAHVGADNIEDGRFAARSLAEALGEQGKVAITGAALGQIVATQRQQGFEEVIYSFPGIELVGIDANGDDPPSAAESTAANLRTYPDLAGILAFNRAGIEVSAEAVAAAGKQDSVTIFGFEAEPSQIEMLRDGVLRGLIIRRSYLTGSAAVRLAYEYLTTGDAPSTKRVWIPSSLVTSDNIDDSAIAREFAAAVCTVP